MKLFYLSIIDLRADLKLNILKICIISSLRIFYIFGKDLAGRYWLTKSLANVASSISVYMYNVNAFVMYRVVTERFIYPHLTQHAY